MVAPKDLYIFTPIILSIASFFFILPFKAQHCYAWIILETSSMFCFTCWGFLLFVDSQWLYIVFWWLTHVVPKVEKLHTEYLLAKKMGCVLLLCSFPMLFV
jgi:hypothetical protein